MTVAPYLNAIRISNFRSIVEPLEVPLKSKMTFLVGQNNSGKTGILRFLGLLLNNGGTIEEDSSTFTNSFAKGELEIETKAILEFASSFQNMPSSVLRKTPKNFTLTRTFDAVSSSILSGDIFQVIDKSYFDQGNGYVRDFKLGGSREANVAALFERLLPHLNFPKTAYVPSHRMILQGVERLPQFGQLEFPGSKIQLHTIVAELARLDRPNGGPKQKNDARAKLADICGFVEYCLEVKKVEIQIPDDKLTINVSIDENEQPISNLGSGIEQLIVIGMGSFLFPNHIVLIDEPELHFHPRTQKRMMQYLQKNADAKFVIATHSAAILDSVDADVVQVWQENHQCFGRAVQNNSDRYEAVRNLGHSPSELVLANFVIWVEGPSDRIYFNHWIEKLDPTLVEGTDYAIVFYGGAVLARHGFEEGDEDLVKALSISRNFAVYMDSDKSFETDELKPRVERVAKEVVASNGLCWISDCREVENYIPESIIDLLKSFEFNPIKKWDRVVKSDKFDKVKLAEQACELWQDEWPHDPRKKCEELVARIKAAR